MRKLFKPLLAIVASGCLVVSCTREDMTETSEVVSQEALAKISSLGFNVADIKMEDGKYIVEGDIILSPADLNRTPSSPRLRIAEVEQYHTFNLVSGLPRTITVTTSGSGITTQLSTAINNAIARYNAENIGLTFVRGGTNGGGTINIKVVRTNQYIAAAGFPSNGNPYNTINYSSRYTKYSDGFMTTVIAHEIGHCIGFRHTDYMNRAYSCGSGGNEGQETSGVGAVQIPGTPSGPDAGSWMLACLSSTTNRPFNANDKIALNYLY